jgi:superfamily I DNA and/or RNA helicase
MYRFNIKGKQKLDENQSLYNIEEILFLKKIVNDLISLGIKSSQIGIISPYAAQVNKLKNFLENFEDLEINTIDGFQ